jgi:uncharacterized protein
MHEQLRYRALTAVAAWGAQRPWIVLIVAVVVAAAAVATAITKLEFQSNRNDLISPHLDWNQRFIDWQDNFPGGLDLVVVIDAQPGDVPLTPQRTARAQELASRLGQQLQAQTQDVQHVVWGFPQEQFSPRAARMLPLTELAEQLQQVRQSRLMLASPTLGQLIGGIVLDMQQQDQTDADEQQIAASIAALTQLIHAIGQGVSRPADQPLQFAQAAGMAEADRGAKYLTESGRLYFVRVTPRAEPGALSALARAITTVRAVMTEIAPHYPELEVGLTGVEVLEADETDAATIDSAIASAVAFVLIAGLLVLAFHSWKKPTLIMVSLLFGIAWTFGFLTLAIGHLQVISVIFAVILLGLGVAFGIHLASSLELLRHEYPPGVQGFTAAFRAALLRTGPGVLTGAITTAAAFATTTFTDFSGVAEMGQIASMGILLCLIAMFTVFPVLLRLFNPHRQQFVPMQRRRIHFFEDRWVMPFVRHPKLTVAVAAVVTIVSLAAASRMQFDYDLMKLQPRGVDSVKWQQRIADQSSQSIWYAITITNNLDQARAQAQQLLEKPTIGGVGGVGWLFAASEPEKLALVAETRAHLGDALDAALAGDDAEQTAGPDLIAQLALLRQMMAIAARGDVPEPIAQALADLRQSIDQVTTAAAALPADERARRLDRLHREYATLRQHAAAQIAAMLDPAPLELDDVPADFLRSYRDGHGRLAMEIYPSVPDVSGWRDSGPLHPQFLPHFMADLQAVDPLATGVIVQIYRSGDLIKRAYKLAGVYALIVVFILVWLDFRSIHDSALTLLPVAVGFAMTFAIMWLLDMKINPANIMVLPLMFGIGVDDGVHMLHRYRMNPDDRPLGLAHGTGKGITITSLTTMIGFGSLMLARHQGIWSLGFTLTLGIGLTMLACWTVMPAMLELHRRSTQHDTGDPPGPAGHSPAGVERLR